MSPVSLLDINKKVIKGYRQIKKLSSQGTGDTKEMARKRRLSLVYAFLLVFLEGSEFRVNAVTFSVGLGVYKYMVEGEVWV